MVIFTSVCANYVHKARTLAQSVKQHIPDAKMILCLVEKEIDPRIPADCFDDIVLAKDAWEGNFDRFIFKHAINIDRELFVSLINYEYNLILCIS